jgi:TonB-dependent receptor
MFVQWNTDWDTALPIRTAAGVRFERTKVISSAVVPQPLGYVWRAPNEFDVRQDFTNRTITQLEGKYDYVLPSIDADMDVTDNQKLRVSYSENIGRPGWDRIQGGQLIASNGRVGGTTGNQGNPNLKPVESKNIDLSYEWYYGKQNFLAVGYFRKLLKNFPGDENIALSGLFGLTTPVGGAYWNDAIASGTCANGDSGCIYNWILANRQGQPGVSGNEIAGQPGDPALLYTITRSANKESAAVRGLEFNVQHMFGNTGFGIAANYTYVRSNLKYNDRALVGQFVLPGLADSANLVGIYEDAKWSVRAAYNWRDEWFQYQGANQGGTPANPVYVEKYGQFDLNVGYNVTDRLSLSFEGLNLTQSVQRARTRTKEALAYVNQYGARYMVGARYKF